MPSAYLYFKVHQPFLLKSFSSMDIDVVHTYFDAEATRTTINAIADQCYIRCNKVMMKLIDKYRRRCRVNFSISGTTIELLQLYRPDVLDSFCKLVNTGCVNILAETYYHSFSALYSRKEFQRQVFKHQELVKNVFCIPTTVFRNTGLSPNNELAGMPVPQQNLLKKIYSLEDLVFNSGCERTIETWGRLQALDHFVSRVSFQTLLNIVTDFEITLIKRTIEKHKKQSALRAVTLALL